MIATMSAAARRRGLTRVVVALGQVAIVVAVLHGLFTVPGDGIVDFPAVIKALAAANYAGWLVQEAEQDPRVAPPLVYAKLGNSQLRRLCGAARLKVA